jgi:hypothetical protein
MAITITRTPWIDDDGSGTTGTVINNAEKTALYNQIDAALAQAAALAGGNTFTGTQTINGTLAISGAGPHLFSAAVAGGSVVVSVRNTAAAAGSIGEFNIGNDADPRLLVLNTFSSAFATSSFAWANGAAIYAGGVGGMSLVCGGGGSMRLYTQSTERLRIAPTGEVMVNVVTNPNAGQLAIATDGSVRPNGIVLQNASTTVMNYMAFINSAGGVAGLITQVTQTTVAYNTSSDRRLKIDRGRATNLDALRGVVVHDFDWKADGRPDRGVFAQEAAAVFPRAITEGADDLTEGGDLVRPWMTDYSKFVPDLIAGWQRHDATIAILRAELAALKGSPNA